jgi:hypothetical protein
VLYLTTTLDALSSVFLKSGSVCRDGVKIDDDGWLLAGVSGLRGRNGRDGAGYGRME